MKDFKVTVIAFSLSPGFMGVVQAQSPASQAMTPARNESTATQSHIPAGTDHDRGVTADTQKNNATYLNLTRRTRRSVVAYKSLSMSAHNVAIVAVDGKVTLKGAVRSQNEKQVVEMKATKIADQDRVVDSLTVALAKQ